MSVKPDPTVPSTSLPVNAYKPWSSEEDLELKRLKLAGYKHSEIAVELGRSVGAVSSRFRFLTRVVWTI